MRAFALALLLLPVTGLAETTSPPDSSEAAYPAIERFIEVLDAVRKNHPEVDKVTYDRLVNHALEGMLASLDPFSSFIHPEMAAAMQDGSISPEVPSLGLTLGLRDDGPYIGSVDPHGPASNAGLLAGSGIHSIDGQDVKGVGLQELLERLTRLPGTVTTLTVKSIDDPKPKEVKLVHRLVETRSLPEARLLDEAKTTGYLRLATFGPACAKEVEAALDDLEDQGMKSLILDLRENGGGSLDETVKILGLVLPPGTPVVTTIGREGQIGDALKTPDRQRRRRDYPMVVLINRMSASASELSAGALQDLKRAKVIGEQSYGKGSVQNIIPMGGGTALRLTFAHYHTPSGKTPHGTGITPDVIVPVSDEDRECFQLYQRKSSLNADEAARLEKWNDPILSQALKTLANP
jgi:carboxyl-terminal processing protease